MRDTDRGRILERGRVLSSTGRDTTNIVGAAGRLLDPGNPLYYAQQYGLVLWLRADMGITTNDPVVTAANDFSNAAWTKTNLTVTTDATTDPLGGSAADQFTDDATLGTHQVAQTVSTGFAATTQCTFSIYLKAGTLSWTLVAFDGGSGGAWFNLGTGAIGTQVACTGTIVSAGNGWYLCSITCSPSTGVFVARMATGNGVSSYSGTGSTVFAYGAALSQPKVSQWSDQSGNGNHAVQATATRQPIYSATGFNGLPCVDYLTGTAYGLSIANISIGANTKMGAIRADASASWIMTHIAEANAQGSDIHCTAGSYSFSHVPVGGAGSRSAKLVAANWLGDGTRRTFAVSFDGTHAGHLGYRNGVLDSTSDAAANNPGSDVQTGTLYIGNENGFGFSLRGVIREIILYSSAMPGSVIRSLHLGMVARSPGAL